MTQDVALATGAKTPARDHHDTNGEGAPTAVGGELDDSFYLGQALTTRGIDLGALSVGEQADLKANILERLAQVVDALVEEWEDEHGTLTEQKKVDRELWRRMTAERDAISEHYSSDECDGCNFQDRTGANLLGFHGLSFCDGRFEAARDKLREIQRPLIETLEAEPSVERAAALGFELIRRHDGRLAWTSDGEEFDGWTVPYADEAAALEDLVAELT